MLSSRSRRFFDPLTGSCHNLVEAAGLLAEALDRFPELGDRVERIGELEERGDTYTLQLRGLIGGTFVTPVDRDELLDLSEALDDVCDRIHDCAELLEILRLDVIPERARAQGRILLLGCERLLDAVERLRGQPDLRAEIEDVYALQSEADQVRRDAIARLFASGEEPLTIVRRKTLHDGLAAAINAARTAARALEAMGLKAR
jgi:uncharacterized protein Yka (UPF0111/DUF47 family)